MSYQHYPGGYFGDWRAYGNGCILTVSNHAYLETEVFPNQAAKSALEGAASTCAGTEGTGIDHFLHQYGRPRARSRDRAGKAKPRKVSGGSEACRETVYYSARRLYQLPDASPQQLCYIHKLTRTIPLTGVIGLIER